MEALRPVRLLFSSQARHDLDEIYDFVRRERPMAAARILERVRASSDQLRFQPHIGRNGTVDGTRELVVRGLPYIIVYLIDEAAGSVVLLAIVHGTRQR